MPKANRLSLNEMRRWRPNNDDFSWGRMLLISEDSSKTVQRYSADKDAWHSSENILFCDLVYVILSLREKFSINKQQFHNFLNEFGTVKNVLSGSSELEKMLGTYGLGKKKYDSIYSAAKEWESFNITERMRDDRNKEFGDEFRLEMIKRIYGIGFKFASLFFRICGYEDMAPPDAWGIRYAESRGFVYRRENSGLTISQGISYEKVLKRHAKIFRVTPALFQGTIYAHWSTWRVDSGAEPRYLYSI